MRELAELRDEDDAMDRGKRGIVVSIMSRHKRCHKRVWALQLVQVQARSCPCLNIEPTGGAARLYAEQGYSVPFV